MWRTGWKAKSPSPSSCPRPTSPASCTWATRWTALLQDAPIRYHRMKGDPTLWLPGTDHASIATEVKVVEQMAKEGLTKEDAGPRRLP